MKQSILNKVFVLAALIVVLSLNFSVSFASTSEELRKKQLEQSPDYYSEENQEKIAELQQKVTEYLNVKEEILLQASSESSTQQNAKSNSELQQKANAYLESGMSINATSRLLEVTMYQQQNRYYCGPATAQMVTYYGGFKLYSQSTLASHMGTNEAQGTIVWRLREGINYYWTNGNYTEITTSSMSFKNGLVYSIDKGRPVPCHVIPDRLPTYSGGNDGHYVLARGYDSNNTRVYYIDPHYDSEHYGKHYCQYSTMSNAINDNAGYYIMANPS